MSKITHIDKARQRRDKPKPPTNVVVMGHIAERLARHRKAMDKLMQDMNLGWHHDCPVAKTGGWILHGQQCIWCDAHNPNSPDDAA